MDNMFRELYGVVPSVRHFGYYIWGQETHFLVHFKALTCLQPCKDLSSKLYGISLIMENELFHCSHLQGKHHPADLLSRPEILEEFSPLQFTEEEAEFLAAGEGEVGRLIEENRKKHAVEYEYLPKSSKGFNEKRLVS